MQTKLQWHKCTSNFSFWFILTSSLKSERKRSIRRSKVSDETQIKSSQTNRDTVLNNARDKFDISIDTSEVTERSKRSHKRYWKTTLFQEAVRRLQIDFSNQRAIDFIEKINSDIEVYNIEKSYNSRSEKFPLKYLQDKYQNTQALRTTYKDTIDSEQKKKLVVIFEILCVATQEFCKKREFSNIWAWSYADINKKSAWLSEVEESQSSSDTDADNDNDTDTDNSTDTDSDFDADSENMSITTYQSFIAEDNDDSDTMNVNDYLSDATHQLSASEDEDLSDAIDAETVNNC